MKPTAETLVPTTPLTLGRRVADVLELSKARIGSFVVLAAFTGAFLAGAPAWGRLPEVFLAALFVGLVSAGSCIFNQILERDLDARMERTKGRPLPAGRISVRDATLWAGALTLAGVVGLAVRFNLLAALLALGTLVVYALVYTPLKRTTTLNTVVGAIPGAMPPLLGYVAIAGGVGGWGLMLFAIIFAWQFPHFFAIAWLHREDYRRGGFRMLPALPGGEALAGRQALHYGLLLLPFSLLPGARGDAGLLFTTVVLGASLAYVATAARFAFGEPERGARLVLYSSLAYLPLVFTVALLDPVVSPFLRP